MFLFCTSLHHIVTFDKQHIYRANLKASYLPERFTFHIKTYKNLKFNNIAKISCLVNLFRLHLQDIPFILYCHHIFFRSFICWVSRSVLPKDAFYLPKFVQGALLHRPSSEVWQKRTERLQERGGFFFSTSKAWQNVQHNCVWHTLSLHSRNILVFLRYSESCQTLWNCTCKYDSHLCSRSWRSDPCTGVSLITSLRGKQMEFR